MRIKFEEKLESVSKELIEMGALIEQAIDHSVAALYEADKDKAHLAIALEKEIDSKERVIEDLCFNILMTEQPVASDLRLISAAMKMITDMERIGDQAADIAEISFYMNSGYTIKSTDLKKMSSEANGMVTRSIDSFVNQDLELAKQVVLDDDIVDDLFLKIRKDLALLIQEQPAESETAMDLLMVIKYLERIADHASNIAEWVIFAITGLHKEQINQPE